MMNKQDRLVYERYLAKLKLIREKTGTVDPFESKEVQMARIKRAKKDYAFFFEYYLSHYADHPCADYHIEGANKLKRDPFYRGIWEIYRGGAKSVHGDMGVPLWLIAGGEKLFCVVVSQNETAAKILLTDIQIEFETNERFKHDFGDEFNRGSWEVGDFITKSEHVFRARGRGQSPRGLRHRSRRPNLFVVDDIDDDELIRNPKRITNTVKWLRKALIPAGDGDGCRYLHLNNRIGHDTVLTRMVDNPGITHHLKVNALDKDGNPTWSKYTKEYYEEMELVQGYVDFQTEYMNNPIVEGTIFKHEFIQWAKAPRIDHFDAIVGFWDIAFSDQKTADYNAIRVWGLKDKDFYCIKSFVRQCKVRDALEWIYWFEKEMPQSAVIMWYKEPQFWDESVKQVYELVAAEHGDFLPIADAERPKTNKLERIMRLLPYYQQNRIYFDEREKSNADMQRGIAQLLAIEPGSTLHDDAPDADEGAIRKLESYIRSTSFTPILGVRQRPSTY